ncbi:MAG TPA: hypothetical protein VGP72_30720 [Planctomycetota bacterium]
MSLIDIWDYLRAASDRRLRQQGYVSSGMGLVERYRRAASFWAPHLENNQRRLRSIAAHLSLNKKSPAGTLLVLGAGRLLDVPWQDLFPLFERVALFDADACTVPYVERMLSAARIPSMPQPQFEIGDLTASVVDLAAWAQHTIGAAASAKDAARDLAAGFERAAAVQPPWARTFVDVRLVISTNLLSQLGYFPRLHVQGLFRKRFGKRFDDFDNAAESLERYFDRIRARHVQDIASFKKSWTYLSTDVQTVVYSVKPPHSLDLRNAPKDAGVRLDDKGQLQFDWPVEILELDDPLHGQKVRELWPRTASVNPPERWAWHIVPQGSEKRYLDRGRVHIVEAWTKTAVSGEI